jgi:hypothetical protein
MSMFTSDNGAQMTLCNEEQEELDNMDLFADYLEAEESSHRQYFEELFPAQHSHSDFTSQLQQDVDTAMELVETGVMADEDIKMEDFEEGQEDANSYHGDHIMPSVEEEEEEAEEILPCLWGACNKEGTLEELDVSEITWVYTRKSQR